jgi:hypothetical protein
MSDYNEKDIDSYISDAKSRFTGTLLGVFGSSWRATVRFFKYLPWRIRNFFKMKYKEYKNRPPRKDVRRVYVLVGYTTKESVQAKYNSERRLIIIRRGLLLLIMVLLFFISLDRVLNITNFDEISHMFGINSFEEITENDPFRSARSKVSVEQKDAVVTIVPQK